MLAVACVFIFFYFHSAKRLTAEERLSTIKAAEPRASRSKARSLAALFHEDWLVKDDFLTIDLKPFIKLTSERLGRLETARDMVASSPDILSGTPVIRGTRVPVHDVAALAAAPGVSLDDILAMYPRLDAEKIELAALYAEANPQRGRPRRVEPPKGARIITDRRVKRRRLAS